MPSPDDQFDPTTEHALRHDLDVVGYARLAGAAMLPLLGGRAAEGWADFADSWNDLGPDRFMADGGRYRRRRHAAFRVTADAIARKPHQPHFQSRDYNPLNGDVQRWFEPVTPAVAEGPVIDAIMRLCRQLFAPPTTDAAPPAWHVELHQFRIEATTAQAGRPTPEGLHRDGVDWVLVMLVQRQNVAEGLTEIGNDSGASLGRFMLADPGDSVVLDDRRIRHGVTEIHPVDVTRPAWRDALVVTFTAESAPTAR